MVNIYSQELGTWYTRLSYSVRWQGPTGLSMAPNILPCTDVERLSRSVRSLERTSA